ncbi:uncharacterized protein [Pagrus major]|uniref:uncharacterized protein n=1 Tax=Pagrus major TaxID=143350 RepID=UPI003CC888E8
MAVTLCLLLFDGNSLAAVNQNQLAKFVDQILNEYTPSYTSSNGGRTNPMFSLAVTIPYNERKKIYDISQVTGDGDRVRRKILHCDVYAGTRVVAATVLRWPNVVDQCPDGYVQWGDVLSQCPRGVKTWADVKQMCPDKVWEGRADHAEYRTLQGINTLFRTFKKKDLLLFYIFASPCDQRCTSESSDLSILNSIKVIRKWTNYAVVFSNIFQLRGNPIPDDALRGSLERLAGSVGLSNIFRCNRQGAMQCTSCDSGGEVARYCFSENSQPSHTKPQQCVSTNAGSSRGGRHSGRGNVRKGGKRSQNVGKKRWG